MDCRCVLPSFGFLPPRQRCRLWKPLPRQRVPFGFPSQQGAPRPYWVTQGQRNCRPFGIPARFEMRTHKWEMVCGHSFQNVNITQFPTVIPPIKEKQLWRFNAVFIEV